MRYLPTFFFVFFCSARAFAWGPPAEIHTKDGSVFYGELVERVPDDHVTIMLATGVAKVIATKDIDPNRAPLTFLPTATPESPPVRVVRTKDGSLYRGVLIEKVAHDHVTLELDEGKIKTIRDEDIDPLPPPPPRHVANEPAPVETIHTYDGDIFHGEIIEKVVMNYVTLRLSTGDVRTIAWSDIGERHRVKTPEKPHPLQFDPTPAFARLQRRVSDDQYEDICAGPCTELLPLGGTYRIVGPSLTPSHEFSINTNMTNTIQATLRPRRLRTAGIVLGATAIPLLIAASALSFVDATQVSYDDYGSPTSHTPLDIASAIAWSAGVTLAIASIILLFQAEPHVRLNGH